MNVILKKVFAAFVVGVLAGFFFWVFPFSAKHQRKFISYPHRVLKSDALETRRRYLEGQGTSSVTTLNELIELELARSNETFDSGSFSNLEKRIDESLKRQPYQNPVKLLKAKYLLSVHRFREGIETLEQYLRNGGDELATIPIRIPLLFGLGHYSEAVTFAEKLTAALPDSTANLWSALSLANVGRTDEAEYYFLRAIETEDVGRQELSSRSRAFYARFLFEQGDNRLAKRYLNEALRIRPDSTLAKSILGELFLREGNGKEAAQIYSDLFSTTKLPRFLVFEARSRFCLGEMSTAEKIRIEGLRLVRKQLEVEPTGHLTDLAQALLDSERPEDWKEALATLLHPNLDRDSYDVKNLKAQALIAARWYVEASRVLSDMRSSGFQDNAWYVLAGLASASTNPRKADWYRQQVLMAKKPLVGRCFLARSLGLSTGRNDWLALNK